MAVQEEPGHVEATRAGRVRLVLGLCAYFASFSVVLYVMHWLIVPKHADFRCDQLSWYVALFAMSGYGVLTLSWQYMHGGWRAWSSRQWPPPGEDVFFRTRVRRGRWVRVHAAITMAVGLALASGVAWLSANHYQLLLEPCARP